MININLDSYAPIISDERVGKEIYDEITSKLLTNDIVSIDVSKIQSMATFCSKQIFGKLYLDLGSEPFFRRIEILNASNNLKSIIRIGIESVI